MSSKTRRIFDLIDQATEKMVVIPNRHADSDVESSEDEENQIISLTSVDPNEEVPDLCDDNCNEKPNTDNFDIEPARVEGDVYEKLLSEKEQLQHIGPKNLFKSVTAEGDSDVEELLTEEEQLQLIGPKNLFEGVTAEGDSDVVYFCKESKSKASAF